MKISPISSNYTYKTKLNTVSFSNKLPNDSFSKSKNEETQEPKLTLKEKFAHYRAVQALKKFTKQTEVDLSDVLVDMQKGYSRQLRYFMQSGKKYDYKGYIPIFGRDNDTYRLYFKNVDREKGTMDIQVMSIDDNFKTKIKYEVLEGKGNYIYHDYRLEDKELEVHVKGNKVTYMKHISKQEGTVGEYKQSKNKLYLMEGVIGDNRVVAINIVNVDYECPENSFYMNLDDDDNMVVSNFDSATLDWIKTN